MPIQRFLFRAREEVLRILRANIKGDRELGLAEALLLGYKNDLDKTLVQSYSNTGVVHVIAISGLHLGLIYWLLLFLLRPLARGRKTRWLQAVLVISGLWAFSLLAGGQPSVLRSAVMFTCIVAGQVLARGASIYNTLAFSAMVLLCYNPYWLWDVGFQLSYSAVLSIVIFMKPIYNWFQVNNKLLDLTWKMNAITLAAQLITLPVSIYHFHQFPLCFWLTNLVAVPLSSIILIGEILLCALSFVPPLAFETGALIGRLIKWMNGWVERTEQVPWALWDGLQINIAQALLLLGIIAGLGCWLLEKRKPGLWFSLLCLLGFTVIRTFSFIDAFHQQKIIVYNVPRFRAVDFIDGRNCFFSGDSALEADVFTSNFHLRPSRILHRVSPVGRAVGLKEDERFFVYQGKRIMLLDRTMSVVAKGNRTEIDLLIVSGNPRIYFSNLSGAFDLKQVVFDGSVQRRRLWYWKRDCDSLNIPWHDVGEQGAFVMKIKSFSFAASK
jgi:competence protein ComEC